MTVKRRNVFNPSTNTNPEIVTLIQTRNWNKALEYCNTHTHAHLNSIIILEESSLLHLSCKLKPPNVFIHTLLEINPHVCSEKNQYGLTPLHIAIFYGCCFDAVKLLIECHPKSVYISDCNGFLPLHVQCSRPNQVNSCDIIKLLLKSGPSTSFEPNLGGVTPFSILCDFIERNSNGDIIINHHWNLVEAFLFSCSYSKKNLNILHILATIPNCPVFLFLFALRKYPHLIHENRHFIPLHAALLETKPSQEYANHAEIIKVLVSASKESLTMTYKGKLPFFLAIQQGIPWQYGVLKHILNVNPCFIISRDVFTGLYAFQLAALTKTTNHVDTISTIFELLRLYPSLIHAHSL